MPGLVTPMAEGSGNSKDKPIYYYWLTNKPLSDEVLRNLLHGAEINRATPMDKTPTVSTYLVLVSRDKDKMGGMPTSRGLLITETFTPNSTEQPVEGAPISGTVSISFRFCDLPEYIDPERTYDSDKYKELTRKIAQIQELLESSMTSWI